MISLYQDVFNSGRIPDDINNTLLCLIPKILNTNNLKIFRPIGLCNTINKIITKVITNRLKPFQNTLISPYQASFLKNRKDCDNAIIIQELILKI